MLNGDGSEMDPINAATLATSLPSTSSEPSLLNWQLLEKQTITFPATPIQGAFKLTYGGIESTSSVNYNGVAADVQAALREITGLESVTVTGSIAEGFIVTMTGVDGDASAITVTTNTLKSVGVTEVQTITFTETPPDEGAISLHFGSSEDTSIDYSQGAADLQTNIRNNFAGLSAATVTGSFAAGLVITFTGYDGDRPAITENSNTLKKALASSVATITETTKGVAMPAVTPVVTETRKGAT